MGSIGAKGGLPVANKPGDVGRKGLKKLADLFPKPKDQRADGVGWRYPHFDSGPGLLHLAFQAIATEDPYPVKAYIAYRHDPLMAYPDSDALKKIFDKLELLVSVTFSWSDTAWYSDVVLPLSPYLERESILACKNGLKPYFFLRQRAVGPASTPRRIGRFSAGWPGAWILHPWPSNGLKTSGSINSRAPGSPWRILRPRAWCPLAEEPKYRARDELSFKTPSGKIEIISDRWENAGVPSLAALRISGQARVRGNSA